MKSSSFNRNTRDLISRVDKNKLTNNTQRALYTLLNPRSKDGWVARTSINVASATARLRDLRKPQYGGFNIQCLTADQLKGVNPSRSVYSSVTDRPTFYRVDPASVTTDSLRAVFGDAFSTRTR